MSRILSHPILEIATQKRVTIYFDGREMEALEGEPIAAALMAAGHLRLRETEKLRASRGVFCGIGQCLDCAMIVDDVPNIRTCITPVRAGMQVKTQKGNGSFAPS